MRRLKKLLLLHWYTYENEIIEWTDINFLTGDTGSGKSTIIDALQLIVLGDSSGAYFNKAANERSERTLKGYLFGEIGDDGDAGFRYLRNGRFTTYVALEFENTVRKENFVVGYVADCYADQTWTQRWFLLRKHGIPEDRFCSEGQVPLEISALRRTLRSRYGKNNVDFYETNRAFQDALLGVYGQIKRKYFTLFRKAVPFTPITNIEQFITDSICDVRNNINIDSMQSDIREYKLLEDQAEITRKRMEALSEIDEDQKKLDDVLEKLRQQQYVVMRAEKEEKAEALEALREAADQDKIRMAESVRREKELSAAVAEMDARYEKLNEEYLTSDIIKRGKQLEAEIRAHGEKIAGIEGDLKRVLAALHRYGADWSEIVRRFPKLAEDREVPALLEQMARITGEQAEKMDFPKAAAEMQKLLGNLYDLSIRCRSRAEELRGKLDQLKKDIADLKKGIKPYPKNVILLRDALREHFQGKADVRILADLLEIRDASWRNAIEGYLDRQKFYLLVPPDCYKEALAFYDAMRSERPIYDAGLIDIGSLRREYGGLKPAAGSLAGEITTEDPDARLYADYILGKVMKCDRAEDLNRYHTAITRNVMLYKNYVARRLHPDRYRNPFIGRSSLKKLLDQWQEEYENLRADFDLVEQMRAAYDEALKKPVMNGEEAENDARILGMRPELLSLRKERDALKEEYDHLDFSFLEPIRQQMEEIRASRAEKSAEAGKLHDLAIRLDAEIKNLTGMRIPAAEEALHQVADEIAASFDAEWIESVGEPRYEKERDQGTRRSLTLAESFRRMVSMSTKQAEEFREVRNGHRRNYNNEYKMPYDSESEDNGEYHREYVQLSEIKLPEYIDKIRDSRKKAYEQFRDDFIAKLKENIETVRQQIRELNEALRDRRFGRDSYQFEIAPRSEYKNYYDMIMDPLLLDTGGWNIASDAFNKKYQKEIDSLFQLLIMDERISAERQREYEKNIQKYTDYRTYLVFDLIVTNDRGEKQRLSRTLLKKSGGETQLPFYIAMLASFAQTCRLHTQKDDTIHLIVLDEAFSKMDSERILECIRLLRQIGLQAVFSAPSEKMGDIAPYVDRTIVVYRKPKEHVSFTRYFDPKQMEEMSEDGV